MPSLADLVPGAQNLAYAKAAAFTLSDPIAGCLCEVPKLHKQTGETLWHLYVSGTNVWLKNFPLLGGMHSNISYLYKCQLWPLTIFQLTTEYLLGIWKALQQGFKKVGSETREPGCDSWFYHSLPLSSGNFLSLPWPEFPSPSKWIYCTRVWPLYSWCESEWVNVFKTSRMWPDRWQLCWLLLVLVIDNYKFTELPLQTQFFLYHYSPERYKGKQGKGKGEWDGRSSHQIWLEKGYIVTGGPCCWIVFFHKKAYNIVRLCRWKYDINCRVIYKHLQLLFNKQWLSDHLGQALCIMLRMNWLYSGEVQEELGL